MRAFLCLFCFISVTGFAQVPYLERDATANEFRRIDPAGIISTTINDPLPFRYGYPFKNPVTTQYHLADYYSYKNNPEGVYEYTRSVSYDQYNRIIEEKRLNKFTGQLISTTTYLRDKLGRITTINNYGFELEHFSSSLLSARTLTYDELDGILIADSTVDYSENKISVSGVELIRDQKKKPVTIKCYSTTNGKISHNGYFELNYRNDSLTEIIQYSQLYNGDKLAPVYRYYELYGNLIAPISIAGYSSAWMENGEWRDFRVDHREVRKNNTVFESTSLSGTDKGTIIRNEFHTDAFGNLINMNQELVSESYSELAGELRYNIDYDKVTGKPSTITTFFLDENRNMQPSLRIEVANDLAFINKSDGSGLSVFPNPASDMVNIHWKNELLQIVIIELQTVTGKIVKGIDEAPMESNSVIFSLNDIAPGMYQISLSIGRERKTVPLIVLENK